jgi:O-glycosyl hydrolase
MNQQKRLSAAFLFFFLCLMELTIHAADTLKLTINLNKHNQAIDHIGASVGFRGNHLATTWPEADLSQLSKWLFSRARDDQGNPLGIALSSWRVELGAGTQKQGEASGLPKDRRTDSFLGEDGGYDWTKQPGARYWIEQAYQYDVPVLIGYSVSPPIEYTENGYGYCTPNLEGANLKTSRYDDFAQYLAAIARHFEDEGTPFDLIAPVNEPQWDWSYPPGGPAKQEGSHWHNHEIRRLVRQMDRAFDDKELEKTRILIPEAGSLKYLYGKSNTNTGHQLRFWMTDSPLGLADLEYLSPYVAGHSYWTERDDEQLLQVRHNLSNAFDAVPGATFWQTEYSFLSRGYLEGDAKAQVTEIDGALWLAKVIHHDLTVADAQAWQWWASFSRGKPKGEAQRFTLIACKDPDRYRPTKNLWALGQFSRFVRPGMVRVGMTRSEPETLAVQAQRQMSSAYVAPDTGRIVLVLINYEQSACETIIRKKSLGPVKGKLYVTDKRQNLDHAGTVRTGTSFTLPPRSISTIVIPPRQ